MSDKNQIAQSVAVAPNYWRRVLASETLKKGVATAFAAAIIGAISEALWPSKSLPS